MKITTPRAAPTVFRWFALGLLFLLTACGKSPDNKPSSLNNSEDDDTEARYPQVALDYRKLNLPYGFESRMTPREIETVQTSLLVINQMDLHSDAGSRFEQIFGNRGSESVMKYLAERVSYFVSPRTQISKTGETARMNEAGDHESIQLAANIGVIMWMVQEAGRPQVIRYRFPDREIEANESRIGVVKIGGVFKRLDAIAAAVTLVHEARHSDCTGGIGRDEVKAFVDHEITPVSRECGHFHSICKSGDLAGLAACDDKPWGAYAVELQYARTIQNTCTHCTEHALAVARIMSDDAATRFESVDQTSLRDPDMSSSGVR